MGALFGGFLFEANTNFLPSGENIGKPSNVPLKVIRFLAGTIDIDLVKIESSDLEDRPCSMQR
jgi:hypothetical protein